jgi:hypothetical protein
MNAKRLLTGALLTSLALILVLYAREVIREELDSQEPPQF